MISCTLIPGNGLDKKLAEHGLQHFRQKYGISSNGNHTPADIQITYSPLTDCDYKVQIILNDSAADQRSYIDVHGEKTPIFKIPQETTGELHIARTITGDIAYPCISIKGNRINIGFDVFTEIGQILAGNYDEYFLKRDSTGMSLRTTPIVDILEDALMSAIAEIIPEARLQQKIIWPSGHRFALVLTHDVDRVYKTYQYIPSILNSIRKSNFGDLEYHLLNLIFKHGENNPYWTFSDIIKLEESLGVKSTYYFLNEKGRVNPFRPQSWIYYGGRYSINKPAIQKSIRELNVKGFEIGIHGSFNSYNNLRLLRLEKQMLENILNSKVTGIRQHYLNYDKNTPWIHNSCGLKYDTSIGYKPGYGIGFRRGTSYPFFIMLPEMTILPLLEIPLAIMDTALDSVWTREHCFKLIDQAEKYQGALTILWHTNIFNRLEYPKMTELYAEIIKKAKEKGAWIARASDVYKWVTESKIIKAAEKQPEGILECV